MLERGRLNRSRGGCTCVGVCVLALQAAAQDLDGGGLVVSGAQVVQARRGRASDCGAAAQKRWGRARAAAQWRASGAAAARSGEQAARERRRRDSAGVAAAERCTGAGAGAAVSRGGRETVSETDAWARGRIK